MPYHVVLSLKEIAKKRQSHISDSPCSRAKPLFLAVGLHKPHVPFKFPQEYLKLYPFDSIGLPKNNYRPTLLPDVAWNPWTSVRQREDFARLNLSFPFGPMPPRYTRLIRQHYYAAVSYADAQVGQILEAVAANDSLCGDTVVALIGDHGWSLGENMEFAKFGNFETATRVPMLLHAPTTTTLKSSSLCQFHYCDVLSEDCEERTPLNVVSQPVELLDLFPTLVELAKLPKVPKCTEENKRTETLCTEGKSLAGRSIKTSRFAFSQVLTQ